MDNAADDSSRPLVLYLDELVEKLRALLPQAVEDGDVEAIHQSRVATRRLKAAIDLFEPVLSDTQVKPFRKTLRRLRRRFGPLRDFDVMLGHLQKWPARKSQAGAVDWIRRQLQHRRDEAHKTAAREIAPSRVLGKLGVWWGISRELEKSIETAASERLMDSVHDQLRHFRSQADGLGGVIPSSGAPGGSFDAHQLRISGKLLRYTLEMSRVHGFALPPAVLRAFKRMQDALGLWHDYVVLSESCMDISAEQMLAHHDADLQDRVLLLARSALGRSKQQLGKFNRLWNENGLELARTIESIFPAPAVIESQTDRDPAGSDEPSVAEGSATGGPAAA